MSRDELIHELQECAEMSDREAAHTRADEALLRYIDDVEVTALFNSQEMWTA